MTTESDLLQDILTEIKGTNKRLTNLERRMDSLETKIDQHFTELKTDIKVTHSVLGELQGDIEELQADTEYLTMRKLIDKKRKHENKLLRKFTPPEPE
jgi:chromosome segregation ATPase